MNRKGFTLIELIVVVGVITMIAMLVYPPYRSSLRSFDLSTTKTSLQQNARIAMKRMVKELGAGMIVDMKEDDPDWDPTGEWDYYRESHPYFIIFHLPDESDPKSPGNEIALYTALSESNTEPLDPASASDEERPLLYIREYESSWGDPEPIIPSEQNLKVTQLCFILGGDNQDRVLITLELAQEGPTPSEWRTYKLVSTAKLGAR